MFSINLVTHLVRTTDVVIKVLNRFLYYIYYVHLADNRKPVQTIMIIIKTDSILANAVYYNIFAMCRTVRFCGLDRLHRSVIDRYTV